MIGSRAPASISRLSLESFARLHSARSGQLMWFLGAGASVSAGVPTAAQLIWQFKRFLYATQTSTPIAGIEVSDPVVRRRLQRHFDEQGEFPRAGTPEEYAAFFEGAYPHAADRRRMLDDIIAAARPAYGQLALAALMVEEIVSVIWTTNFDRAVEDAASSLSGTTTTLTTAHLAEPALARRALGESDFPLLVKLHGDYQSDNLKNTSAELREQDKDLRETLQAGCQRFGLVVAGYSGRDASVMDALAAAVAEPNAFPTGLFWIHREPNPPDGPPADLLQRAAAAGIQAAWVQSGTFDELMGEILIPIELSATATAKLNATRPPARFAPFALAPAGTLWPVIRLNALRLIRHPTTCRRVQCGIGGTGEVRRAVTEAQGQVIALRRRDGVVGFGPDGEFRRIFDPYRISTFDEQPLVGRAGSSTDVGLLYEALSGALARERHVVHRRMKGHHVLTIDPALAADARFAGLRSVASSLTGTIPGTALAWTEGVELSLEWHNGQPWLVFDPVVWAERPPDEAQRNTRLAWLKNRTAPRYNRAWNSLFEAWSAILAGPGPVSLYGIAERDGVDAIFELDPITAFSRAPA
ncbi:MAG: SIR2 family protein [Chloroflexota bacterium]|nr:SIR2 family protein [Chloroflexota bacterium]